MNKILGLLFLSLLAFGCLQSGQPTPSPTPKPTAVPTATPVPTAAATPTLLPSPMQTPIPSITPSPSLPVSCLFDSDCGPEERCNIALGRCESVRATPLPTTSPTPVPRTNETERLQKLSNNLEVAGNRLMALLSTDYLPFQMKSSDYDAYNTPTEYRADHVFKVSRLFSGMTLDMDSKFGLQVRQAPVYPGRFSFREGSKDNVTYYVGLFSDLVPSTYAQGNSSAFWCYNNSYRVLVYFDAKLFDALAQRQSKEPITYVTESLMGACPAE